MVMPDRGYSYAGPHETQVSVSFRGVTRYLLWVAAVLVTINLIVWPVLMIVSIAAIMTYSNN